MDHSAGLLASRGCPGRWPSKPPRWEFASSTLDKVLVGRRYIASLQWIPWRQCIIIIKRG